MGITSDKYDAEVMTFEEDVGKFEMGNRAYDEYGVCPTIKACGDINVLIHD